MTPFLPVVYTRRVRQEVEPELLGIWTQPTIESLFSNVRQRTNQIDVFTTEMNCLTIVWATIQGIALRKIPV